MPNKLTCFVVQGFGKKTDYTTGKEFDLNASYEVIKMAVEASGLLCIRADEIVHSGTIDVPMYERLLNADLVIADLSTYNVNAAFELGVRYALKPHTTIVLAEESFKNPFDLSHIVIRRYKHLGEDIGNKEAKRLNDELTEAIMTIVNMPKTDSPVYTYLPGLQPPQLGEAAAKAAEPGVGQQASGEQAVLTGGGAYDPAKIDKMRKDYEAGTLTKAEGKPPMPDSPLSVPIPSAAPPPSPPQAQASGSVSAEVAELVGDNNPSAKALLDAAMDKMYNSEFEAACKLLKTVHEIRPDDTFVVQQMALATYKSQCLPPIEALAKAKEILLTLNPAITNNPETLGLWGSVHKKIWEITQNPSDLNEAISAHERGFYLKQDNYNGINLAYLLNVRALARLEEGDKDEAIADTIMAKRVRQDVIRYATAQMENYPLGELADLKQATQHYWLLATLYEANIGLGNYAAAEQWKTQAETINVPGWIQETRLSQDEKLQALLDKYKRLIETKT